MTSSELLVPEAAAQPPGVPPKVQPWALSIAELSTLTGSGPAGLEPAEAGRRLRSSGPHAALERRSVSVLRVLTQQLGSPLLLMLVFAAAVSALKWVDAGLVLSIVLASVSIGARREYKGQAAAAALAARIRSRATVLRGGEPLRIPADQVVVGDVVLLAAGSLVPADAVVIEASDCHVNEAVLTGEAFSVEKTPGVLPAATPLARRVNSVYLGSNVQSGTARCLVVAVGPPPSTAPSQRPSSCVRRRPSSTVASPSSATCS